MDIEALATIAVDCGFKVHERLGPGLLESVYEAVLAQSLSKRGLAVERQKPVPIRFDGLIIDEGFRADLLVEGRLLIELKSVERTAPVHAKQVLTYLRLMDLPPRPPDELRRGDVPRGRPPHRQQSPVSHCANPLRLAACVPDCSVRPIDSRKDAKTQRCRGRH